MRFMVMVPASAESEAGVLPDGKLLAAMGRFNEELVKAGVLLGGEGLQDSSKGVRIRFGGSGPTVTEGPFPGPAGLIAGYWIIKVESRAEAVAWMQRAPFGEGTVLELRQIFEAGDFAPSDADGALRAQEERLRAQAAR